MSRRQIKGGQNTTSGSAPMHIPIAWTANLNQLKEYLNDHPINMKMECDNHMFGPNRPAFWFDVRDRDGKLTPRARWLSFQLSEHIAKLYDIPRQQVRVKFCECKHDETILYRIVFDFHYGTIYVPPEEPAETPTMPIIPPVEAPIVPITPPVSIKREIKVDQDIETTEITVERYDDDPFVVENLRLNERVKTLEMLLRQHGILFSC